MNYTWIYFINFFPSLFLFCSYEPFLFIVWSSSTWVFRLLLSANPMAYRKKGQIFKEFIVKRKKEKNRSVKALVPNWLMTLRLFTFKSRIILHQRELINLSSCPVFNVGSQYSTYCTYHLFFLIPVFFSSVLIICCFSTSPMERPHSMHGAHILLVLVWFFYPVILV